MILFDFFKKTSRKTELKNLKYYEILNKEIRPLEDVMVGFSSSLSEIHKVDEKIEVLKALIQSYYDLRSKCVSLGKDYQDYFSKMWEHCHNSKNPDFCFIDRFEQELYQLESNRNMLFAEQELYQEKSKDLKRKVIEILAKHKEIVQTDIYKKFDPIVQKDIQNILYFLAKEGVIEREKYKKTYKIKFKGED